jgi:NAD(P) transhydrogenase
VDTRRYDLFVIGSGPAGQRGAIAAARLGKRVGIADAQLMLGGVSLHQGTIPSKSLREAILHLTGLRDRAFQAASDVRRGGIRRRDLMVRVDEVIRREVEVVQSQLARSGVEILPGLARFVDARTVEVRTDAGPVRVAADFFLVACGTRPAHSPEVPVDGERILDTDQLLGGVELDPPPRRTIVVGAGVIGIEYASMACALGHEVRVVDPREEILDSMDREIAGALVAQMEGAGASFALGDTVEEVSRDGDIVAARLRSGRRITADVLLYAVGRQPNTDRIGVDATGIALDGRGRIRVDDGYRTSVPHIYAAGDVIGFPALAATSMEQGRIAASRMFGAPAHHVPELLPYGIYTIPEMAMVGKTESRLAAEGIAYAVGTAPFEELARAQILGERVGLLKLVFSPATLAILGVHVFGQGASELVHIGQMAMRLGATVEDLRDTVFNYPTFAEAYKVAALDGLQRI